MIYKIYNKGKHVKSLKTVPSITKYLKSEHKINRGYGERTLKNKFKDNIENVDDVKDIDNKAISYIDVNDDLKIVKVNDGLDTHTFALKLRKGKLNEVGTNIKRTYHIPYAVNTTNYEDFIGFMINEVLKLGHDVLNNRYIKIILSDKKTDTNGSISTPYMDWNSCIANIKKQIINALNIYDDDFYIKILDIRYSQYNISDPSTQIVYGIEDNNDDFDTYITKMLYDKDFKNNIKKKMIRLFNKYSVISPVTTKNCLIQAFFLGCGISKDDVYNKTIDFVKDNKLSEVDRTADNLNKIMCEKMSKNLKIINQDGVEKYYDHKFDETVNIFYLGTHAYGLIEKKEEEKEYKQIMIPMMKDYICKKYKICTWDIETYDKREDNKNVTECYAIGFYDGKQYLSFYEDKIDESTIMCRFISSITGYNKGKKIILYAHNSGKFDSWWLLKKLLNYPSAVLLTPIIQNNRILDMTVKIYDTTIMFRDSFCFLTGKLDDICNDFNTKVKKLTGTVNHNKINKTNFYKKETHNYVGEYLKNDCISLYEALIIYKNKIYKAFNVDICSVLTNAGIARTIFFKQFYDESKPIYNIPDKDDYIIREGYMGGRNECFEKIGVISEPIYYYDFTSHYPSVMKDNKYPYGEYEYISYEEPTKFNDKWNGYVICYVKHTDYQLNKKNKLPYHCMYKEGKLIFPYIKNKQKMILFTEDIKYSIKNNLGYEYEIIGVYNYENMGYIFKDIVEHIYKLKIKSKNKKDKSMEKCSKLIINSLYGFFGIKYMDIDSFKIIKKKNKKWGNNFVLDKLLKNKLKDVNDTDIYSIVQYIDRLKTVYKNVGIASCVTSYGRMRLYELMNDIKNSGGIVYYCDTDSIHTNYCMEDDKKLYNKWFSENGELGKLKNETGINKGYYDTYMVLGNKMYYLENKELENNNIVKAFKGLRLENRYNKRIVEDNKIIYKDIDIYGEYIINKEDYKLMCDGYELQVDNMTFRSGATNCLINNDSLNKLENDKLYKKGYMKGNVIKDVIKSYVV